MSAEYFAEHFYDSLDKENKSAVTDAVVTSYVNVIGDIYSVYRPKEEFDEHIDDMSGSFGGIGVTIALNYINETARITEVGIGTPAERAGLAVGDYIYAVDDMTLDDIGFRNVARYTRGNVGDAVKITVKRGDELRSFTMTREVIEVKSVEYSIDEEKIGYIRISSFKGNTYEQFVEAIDYMEGSGALGIIFDVRGNPGGYLDSVADILSYILPTGKEIVSYNYKDGTHVSIRSTDDKHPTTGAVTDHTVSLPMAVICNEYSASAAEIFTAAIRDYRDGGLIDAVTVGKTTYKKGIIQASFVYKSDGSSVTLTIAYYAPPSGVCYHGIGITPDFTVEPTENEDTQYSEALRHLKELIN
jgi:carboxyl-terminal processing protease